MENYGNQSLYRVQPTFNSERTVTNSCDSIEHSVLLACGKKKRNKHYKPIEKKPWYEYNIRKI